MLRTPAFLCLFAAFAAAQPPSSSSDPLQALLAEVHQLRLDLQATTVTAQRVQILLYRVQLQQAATARLATRADEVRSKLADAQQQRGRAAAGMKESQDLLNGLTEPAKIAAVKLQVEDFAHRLELWQSEEQQWQARDAEAQSQLRAEQSKLEQLQDTLDRLDKALAALAKP